MYTPLPLRVLPHVRRFADAPAARTAVFNFMLMFFCDQKNQKSWGLRDAPKPLNAFKGPAGPLKIPVNVILRGIFLYLHLLALPSLGGG